MSTKSVFENNDFSISCNSDICHYYDTVHCSWLTSYVISLAVRVLCRMSSHATKMRQEFLINVISNMTHDIKYCNVVPHRVKVTYVMGEYPQYH